MGALQIRPLQIRRAGKINAAGRDKAVHLFKPHFERLLPYLRMDEVFDFHLLKLALAKDKVARRDFVAKSLADLRDAEWHALAARVQNLRKIHEHGLRGFPAHK